MIYGLNTLSELGSDYELETAFTMQAASRGIVAMKVRQRWEAVASKHSANNNNSATTNNHNSTTNNNTTNNNSHNNNSHNHNPASTTKGPGPGLAPGTDTTGVKSRGGVAGGVGRMRGGGVGPPRKVLRRELFVISGEVVVANAGAGTSTNHHHHSNNATAGTAPAGTMEH